MLMFATLTASAEKLRQREPTFEASTYTTLYVSAVAGATGVAVSTLQ